MFRFVFISLVLILLMAPLAAAQDGKCHRILPDEVFAFFGDKPSRKVCADYEYKLVDLNGDDNLEVVVTNYRRSCEDTGFCNFEIFQKQEKGWKHIATIPGRVRVLETKTKGYVDLATWLLGHRYVYVWDGNTYRDIMHAGGERESKSPEKSKTPKPPVKATPTPEGTESTPVPSATPYR